MKSGSLTLKLAVMESDKGFIAARRYLAEPWLKKYRLPKQRGHKNLWDTTKGKHGHTAGGKVTDSKRELKYKFNDVQVCDISLLSAGIYSREAGSI